MTFDSPEEGYTKYSWKAKQNETKWDVSYTSLKENQGLKEVCKHLSIQQVSAWKIPMLLLKEKRQVPANVMNLI